MKKRLMTSDLDYLGIFPHVRRTRALRPAQGPPHVPAESAWMGHQGAPVQIVYSA